MVTQYEAPLFFNHIKFFSLNKTNYTLKEIYTIDLPIKIKADDGKLRFTNDNKYLFINLR